MEFRQLQFFLEVAKQESFTKAAKEQLVAQPAISKSIQNLENELGVYLFNRRDKRVVLTTEGKRFLSHAKAIQEQVEAAKLEMEEFRGFEKGEVTIGLPSMAGSYFFPNIIVDFKSIYPHLSLSIVEAGTKKIQAMIEEGEIDMGVIIIDEHTPHTLELLPFLSEEMVVCVPVTHKLANQATMTYEQLANEPLVLFKEGYYQRDIISEAGKKSNITPTVSLETNQISLTKSLTRKGLGITLFLKMVISDDDDLVPVSLDPPRFLQLGLAWKKRSYLSKANQAFIDFLMEQTNQ
ncbi:LysR family transcriptional regulator [Desertibacillus haloalkaliphilus]|uniref:LysR family transcriptional regulator n=1 Tax=Desertibacillus haloalkaliphilus TaxID=1328930 RepID=UPI001C259E2B|nr:LysR family transcriptional regulator [Desertibacillus haloalkaliphilus]MBU8906780.1 LysR family transcriptional regulator [Desertibacillus haloalkaliphilus]